jgi:PIN domain nuclease of toxin-antitoxin system
MRLLIDTHTFLWFVTNDLLLSAAALEPERCQVNDFRSLFG